MTTKTKTKTVVVRSELAAPITDLDSAKAWIRDLVKLGLDFHLEDDPAEIICGATRKRLFTDAEVPIVRKRVRSLYRLKWGADECPIGYMMRMLDEKPATKRYFKDFNEIELPEWLLALGFEDDSWDQDACARATAALVDSRTIDVWIDFDDKSRREISSNKKFSAFVYLTEDSPTTVCRTEKEDDFRRALVAFIAQFPTRQTKH